MEIFTAAHKGQATPCLSDRQKEKARPEATPDEPNSENNNNATVAADSPDRNFADVRAEFALLGYELRAHRTLPGLVHQPHAQPKPSKPSKRTTFVIGHWSGSRHVASWHGVVGLLASLQDSAKG